jgi:CHAD domain-containing protein
MEPDYVRLREIKPVLAGYIREALTLVRMAPVPDEKAIHDIRVLMKKSRAVMRLIGNQIDEESFNRNYDTFRDVGRLMCSWRDTSVHRKTLKQLKKSYPEIFDFLGANEKVKKLLEKTVSDAAPVPELKNDLEKIAMMLTKAGFRIRFESLKSLDPRTLLQELDKTYNIVIEKYLICRNDAKPLKIHEFRKRAKDFLYQLYFFRPLNQSVIKSIEKKLDIMTQNLGKYHDLAQLIKILGYKYSKPDRIPALDELIIVIREEQDRYLLKTWPVAHKIFCPGQPLVNLLGFKVLII